MKDSVTPQEEQEGMLRSVYLDGKLLHETTLAEIRGILQNREVPEEMVGR